MQEMFLSFIIPVYNCEKYIERCVNSILGSIPSNLAYEIILVNDGSLDNSGEICKKLELLNSKVSLISQRNKGASAARNTGLDNAHGKYIWFIDADDMIYGKGIKYILEALYSDSYDLIIFNHYVETTTGKREVVSYSNNNEISGKDFLQRNEALYLWNKVYSRKVVANNRFLDGTKNLEDFLFNINVLENTSKIKQLSAFGYIYNSLNFKSTSRSRTVKNLIKLSLDTYKVHSVLISKINHDQLTNRDIITNILNTSIAGHLYSLIKYYNAKHVFRAIGWYRARQFYPIKQTTNKKANLFIKVVNTFTFREIVYVIMKCKSISHKARLHKKSKYIR